MEAARRSIQGQAPWPEPQPRDLVGEILAVIDRALRLVGVSQEARQAVGLRGVSEFILGRPGWYLWPSEEAGAYGLELAACRETGSPGQSQGSFLLKHYPALDSPILARFGALERLVRDSDYFDSTGTPTLDGSLELPPELFVVGRLDYGLDLGQPALCLHLEAPERWETICEPGLSLAGPEEEPLLELAPGSLDRRVPAWDLAWSLVDHLLRLLCLAYRAAPRAVRTGLGAPGPAEPSPGRAIRPRQLRVELDLRHQHGPQPLLSLAQAQAPRLLPDDLAPGHDLHRQAPSPPVPWLNPAWWEVGRRHYSAAGAAPC